MKISYKNTALGVIDNPKNYDFGFPPDMINGSGRTYSRGECITFGLSLLDGGHDLKSVVGNNIQLVKSSFWNAYASSFNKIKKIMFDVEIEETGVLILDGNPFSHTYYYYINTHGSGDDWDFDILFMDFSKLSKNDMPHLDVFVSRESTKNEDRSLIWKSHLDEGRDSLYWVNLLISFIVFKKYCDVETNTVEGNRKLKTPSGVKYVNETNKNITILDCTWFTTLVRTGAFSVGDDTGGFLRWQPWGPNNAQRKLIWVSPFEKEGYTRKAKVLTQNNQQYGDAS
jgi:hypothetical protein